MKKLFYLLMCLPLAFASCTPPAEEEPTPEVKNPQLILTSDDVVNAKADGGTVTVEYMLINAKEGAEFTAENEAQWISNFVFGDEITFDVAVNETTEAREAKITFKYDVASMEVTVKQAGKKEEPKAPVINITSEMEMEFGQDEALGTITYTIENPIQNVELSAKANVNWISQLTVQSEKVLFQVAANTGDAREGIITLTYGMLEAQVIIKQVEYVAPAPVINVDPAEVEIEAAGGAVSVAYSVANPVEGVELTAACETEWISNVVVAEETISFDVAVNEESLRQGIIVLTYGEVVYDLIVKQLPEDYNPDMVYSVFTVVDAWAECKNGAKQWDITFVEKDDVLGEMQTRISFALSEVNPSHPTEGHYSVADGSILVNGTYQNGFSTYRANASLATDITAAEFDIAVDTDNKTVSIVGYFQAANNIISVEYNGEMSGMDLSGGQGNTHFTDWKWVRKNWEEAGQSLFTARSTDGALEICFDIRHSGGSKLIPAATYEVMPHGTSTDYVANSSYLTLNSVKSSFAAGTVVVEHIRGGYIITFDITDDLGRPISGVIQGAIENGTNP